MTALNQVLPIGLQESLREHGFNPVALRAVGFNKSGYANWSLPWHQDRVIFMTEKCDDPNFQNWSPKDGMWHCEPTEDHLSKMAFLYIAFDTISEDSGGLALAEGTHRSGKIAHTDIRQKALSSIIRRPLLLKGECLLISALTLHRSSKNLTSSPRRSMRLDFISHMDGDHAKPQYASDK